MHGGSGGSARPDACWSRHRAQITARKSIANSAPASSASGCRLRRATWPDEPWLRRMTRSNKNLPLGYSNAAPGHVVSVVTCLEMLEKPTTVPAVRLPDGITLDALHRSDLPAYRA